jgi:hypothetical protein
MPALLIAAGDRSQEVIFNCKLKKINTIEEKRFKLSA